MREDLVIVKMWNRLIHKSKSPFPVLEHEQEVVTNSMKKMLQDGWNSQEIVLYLSYTEYFNTQDSEQHCLDRMAAIAKTVENRLALALV